VRAVLRRGVVKCGAAVLVAGHPRAEKGRVTRDHAAHGFDAVERDRGPQIEPRPVIEEIGRDVLPHAAEAGRPAEDADLVIVALAVDVGAGLHE
jgi:hypothetical protein